jgi:ElaB/YqjD/DUF883 family membrane-anchored ribosome-binding protein
MTKPEKTPERDEQTAATAPQPGREDEPERIRGDIEETREDLGETVDALASKTDVKGQVKERAEERKRALRTQQQRAQEKASEVRERLSNATPEDAKAIAGQATAAAKERPMPAIFGALIVGLLLGRASSRR